MPSNNLQAIETIRKLSLDVDLTKRALGMFEIFRKKYNLQDSYLKVSQFISRYQALGQGY